MSRNLARPFLQSDLGNRNDINPHIGSTLLGRQNSRGPSLEMELSIKELLLAICMPMDRQPTFP